MDNEASTSRQELRAHAEELGVVYGYGDVASWSEGVWTRDRADWLEGPGSLAIDAAGGAHRSGGAEQSGVEGGTPVVAYGARPLGDDEWTWETIDERDDSLTAIALDAEERPNVAYVKDQAMMLAFRDGELDGIDQNCDGVDGHWRDW